MPDIYNAHDIKPDNQVFAQTAADMRSLIRPLEKIGIMHFAYQVMHGNHTFEILTTHPGFSQLFIDEKFYKFALAGEPSEYVDGFVLGDDLGQSELLHALTETTGVINGVAIIKTHSSFVEIFYFGSNVRKTQSFYVNHLAFLEKFILFFKSHASPILMLSSKKRIYYPGSVDKTILTSSDWQKQNFSLNTDDINFEKRRYASQFSLTEAEIKVAELVKKGLSTKEIARWLFRSPRTIEKHIDKLKEKLGCRTKYQLLSFLIDSL